MDYRPKRKTKRVNIDRALFDMLYYYFLDMSPKAKEIKAKINKWDLIKKLFQRKNY